MSDAHQRAPQVITVEHDRLVAQNSPLPGLSGPG
jgi:hypothetical protein